MFANLGSTEEIPIWEEPSAHVHWQFAGSDSDAEAALLAGVFTRLRAANVPVRPDFYHHGFDPDPGHERLVCALPPSACRSTLRFGPRPPRSRPRELSAAASARRLHKGLSSTAAPSPRPPILVTAGTWLVRLARHARDGRAGHGGALASFCLARLLALEESSRTWASPHSRRVVAADPAHRH